MHNTWSMPGENRRHLGGSFVGRQGSVSLLPSQRRGVHSVQRVQLQWPAPPPRGATMTRRFPDNSSTMLRRGNTNIRRQWTPARSLSLLSLSLPLSLSLSPLSRSLSVQGQQPPRCHGWQCPAQRRAWASHSKASREREREEKITDGRNSRSMQCQARWETRARLPRQRAPEAWGCPRWDKREGGRWGGEGRGGKEVSLLPFSSFVIKRLKPRPLRKMSQRRQTRPAISKCNLWLDLTDVSEQKSFAVSINPLMPKRHFCTSI